MTRRLTPQHERFCVEYLFDSNGSAAARRAGVSPGMAGKRAHEWLKWPEVQERVAALSAERIKRLQVDQDELVREWREMAKVDMNELVEHRRVNCRHCWGRDHEYQWTPAEFRQAERKYGRLSDQVKRRELPPSEVGGIDYDVTKAPNPKCPECRGEGIGKIVFKDTRDLSPAARCIYEGSHVGKEGQKVLMVDRAKLMEMVGRAKGVFKDRVEHSGVVSITLDRADSEA